ncbi:myeloid leukemia factor isoform X2 [Bicyclus anynana]|uniref:Myeloid leukemia factor isoform X2 n=1 Tax=Bicyclus anynana TaxID=110368 RepID=A0ABM3LWE5_BICAN|nr:myeloid leukemia factor isoform X2 [Bicyclus anynana]
MSLFGSLMGMADVDEDPFFGSHMRHMRQMNNMMNSLFSDPFGMLGEGPLSIMGGRRGNAMMPYMPQMPSINRLLADVTGGHGMGASSYSSSTVVMSSGPNGSPQVYSSTSSTKIGPNGVKETRNTLQDSRTGVKKMSIGHHIGERAHVIEREQNVYSGDAEERQEFINLDEDEAEGFDREFQERAGVARGRPHRAAIAAAPREPALLALPAARLAPPPAAHAPHSPTSHSAGSGVREVYSGSHPQRRHKHHRHRHAPNDN